MSLLELNQQIPEHEFGRVPMVTALEQDFPAVEISRIAEHESWRKEIHRPATSTHKWWAKRLGSVFRGILCAATSETKSQALRAYESATRLDGLTVFDPFAGSGTTVVEGIKLGAAVVGWDINPVATLVQRQAVQRWDRDELERAYGLVEKRCRAEIDRVHKTVTGETVLYYFWVGVAPCPGCRSDVRLFSNHVFSQNAYPKRVPAARIVCPTCLDVVSGRYDFDKVTCARGHRISRCAAVLRGELTCADCGCSSRVVDALGGETPRFEMYAKLVLGSDGKKRYQAIDEFDRSLYADCSNQLREREQDLVVPNGELADGLNTRQAMRWGYTRWRQFFNERQLYSLGLLGSAIRDISAGAAEREALAALFSGTLEFNNMFCSFKGEGTGAVRHMFSHHVLKPERTPLEAHPWGTPVSSGSFSTLFKSRLVRASAYKMAPTDQILDGDRVVRVGGLSQSTETSICHSWSDMGHQRKTVCLNYGNSAKTDLPNSAVDLVVTDPPYVDNVHYSELADFFHAWLREVKPFDQYPTLSVTTRSADEVQSACPSDFEQAIEQVWRECARVLKAEGLLAFTFHQARLPGWVSLVRALVRSGFVVTALQPVKGEMTTSATKVGGEPSNLDTVVVCRKRIGRTLGPLTDPYEAAELARSRLAVLKASKIVVGTGDVRSVIRGHVLATYSSRPTEATIESLAVLADELADKYVALLA